MADLLIVDDEPDGSEAVAGYLQKSGYLVRVVPDGQEAIAALAQKIPDLIILDWMMPKMDGITFIEVIRSYLRWSHIPIILLTAHKGLHIDRAKSMGVNRVFIKGDFEMADLLTQVQSATMGRKSNSSVPC